MCPTTALTSLSLLVLVAQFPKKQSAVSPASLRHPYTPLSRELLSLRKLRVYQQTYQSHS